MTRGREHREQTLATQRLRHERTGSTARPAAAEPQVAASRGVFARLGWLFAVSGALSCNSLLGIGEASLACDPGPCTGEVAGPAAAGGDANDRAGEAESTDEGTALDGAGDPSNGSAAGGAPTSSGASRDGVPVAPALPPDRAASGDTGAGREPPASGAGGSAGSSNGGSAGTASGSAGAASGSAGAASGSAGADGAAAGGDPERALCSDDSACGACLCGTCEEAFGACAATPGCLEIVACARNSGCNGFACYCGSVEPIACATTDRANGPCIAAMLAAPGSHAPSLVDPNAGPASEAALGVADCSAQSCADVCGD